MWDVTFPGEKGTVFEGGKFHVTFDFSDNYPHKAPKIKVVTPIWNHKVVQKGTTKGEICAGTLGEWKPVKNMAKHVIPVVNQMLFFPNVDASNG